MHDECHQAVQEFKAKYISKSHAVVYDFGSMDVNGNLRDDFKDCRYSGIDIEAGPNVDFIVGEQELPKADYIISANVMEHVVDLHEYVGTIFDLLVDGGIVCITTPTTIAIHKHPVDCWRILPDGLKWLMEYYSFTTLECRNIGGKHNDTLYIGSK